MVVPRVEAEQLLPRDAVAKVKLTRPHRAALAADPEELGLDRVEVVLDRERFLEDRVERIGQPLAGREPVGRSVLEAVGHPDIRHAGRAEGLAHRGPDFPRSSAVFDPKLPDTAVGVRQREAVGGLGMAEAGGIEVEPHATLLGPGDPAGEVRGVDLIAVDLPAAEFPVEGVQIKPVFPGDDGHRRVEIPPQLVGRAGAARVVARHRETAAE